MKKRLKIFDIQVSNKSKAELLHDIEKCLKNGASALILACANPHSLVVSRKDEYFKSALNATDVLVADGVGVTFASRYIKKYEVERITGFEMYTLTMNALEKVQGSVFFFGSSSSVLSKITKKINVDYPSIRVCDVLSPPFGEWSANENSEMIRVINESKPDVLWVGMTAPKQEKWVYQNHKELNAKVIGSIGAVFDFYAGTKPRAPDWMCRVGLEWLHRLCKEPKRMWRRNFLSTPIFLGLVLKEEILGK